MDTNGTCNTSILYSLLFFCCPPFRVLWRFVRFAPTAEIYHLHAKHRHIGFQFAMCNLFDACGTWVGRLQGWMDESGEQVPLAAAARCCRPKKKVSTLSLERGFFFSCQRCLDSNLLSNVPFNRNNIILSKCIPKYISKTYWFVEGRHETGNWIIKPLSLNWWH